MSTGTLLLMTAVIPSLAVQFEYGSAVGAVVISTISILSVLIKGRMYVNFSSAEKKIVCGLGLIFIYLIGSGIVSWQVHPNFDFDRFFQSLILIFFCLVGAYCFSALINSCSEEQIDKALRHVFMVILFSSIARVFGIHLAGGEYSRTVFFYNEPSHYALGIAPFLLYMVVSDASRRWIWLVSAISVGLMLQSLTLIIVVLLVYIVVIRISLISILFISGIIVLILLAGDGLTYYSDRLILSDESENWSNLVYLSGWERAWLSINETFFLGYGFNQLGVVGNQGSIMLALESLGAEGLNLFDGGSVVSKLIAEFGVIGIFFMAIYVKFFLRGVRLMRVAMNDIRAVSRIELFFWSCLVMYSVDLFVRGSGYFSAEAFMLLGAIWSLARHSHKHKKVSLRNMAFP